MNINQTLHNNNRNKFSPKTKKYIKIGSITIISILILIVLFRVISKDEKEVAANPSVSKVAGAIAKTDINKEFSLPVPNSKGEEVGMLGVEIISAEKRKEILVKGQKATAVDGREFLIINMKIENELDTSVDLNSRNYIRLSVNGNENEWLAPDIHNDPVEVQAISTKLTRVGFPINDDDSLLMLQIGDIKENKEKVLLEF